MATGYYIGPGTVLEGNVTFSLFGLVHACEGDLVSWAAGWVSGLEALFTR